MSVVADKVLVELEAKLDRFNANVVNGQKTFENSMNRIESRARATESSVVRSFKAMAGAYLGLNGIKAGADLVDTSIRITNALKVAGLQGEELKKVYDSLFASAQRNSAPLESLVTLYGRATLVQKELKVSSADLLKFTDNVSLALKVAGTDATTASGALLQLSQALGSGTVRAEEFNSVQEGALPVLQAAAAGIAEAGGSVAKLRQLVITGKVSSEAFFKGFQAGADTLRDKVAGSETTISQHFVRLQNVLVDAAGEIYRTASGAEGLDEGFKIAENAIEDFRAYIISLIPGLKTTADILERINGVIQTAKAATADAGYNTGKALGTRNIAPNIKMTIDQLTGRSGEEYKKALEDLKKTGGFDKQFDPNSDNNGSAPQFNTSAFDPTGDVPIQLPEVKRRGIEPPTAPTIKKIKLTDYPVTNSAAGGRAAKKIEDDFRSTRERTEQLKLEAEAVGKSTYEINKRQAALDIEQALEADGVKNLEPYRDRIDQMSEAYARQAEILEKVTENHRRAEEAASQTLDAIKGGLKDVIKGTATWQEALSGVLSKLADIAIDSAFDALTKPAGSGPGGILTTIFSSILGGGRASGGPVQPGKAYRVNEMTPNSEWFIPSVPGSIANNNAGAGTSVVRVVLVPTDLFSAQVHSINQQYQGVTIQAATEQAVRTVRGSLTSMQSDVRSRGQ